MSAQTIKLANGLEMPAQGFGCAFGNWTDSSKWMGVQPDLAWAAIPAAIRAGFKHFDGALFYSTHTILGQTLGQHFATGALKRSDVWVTTKVAHPWATLGLPQVGNCLDWSGDIKPQVRKQIEKCLDELCLGYVDLMLMHWPGVHGSTDEAANKKARQEVWEVFEEYYEAGKIRAIGVSNFHKRHLEPLMAECKVKPMVNQIEVSPYMTQTELVDYCKANGIVVEAWAPFGSGFTGVLGDATLKSLAEKYKKNVGQVILRWLFQRGICSLPKSTSEERMRSNMEIFDFELLEEEVASITALNKDMSSVGDVVPGSNIA